MLQEVITHPYDNYDCQLAVLQHAVSLVQQQRGGAQLVSDAAATATLF